MKRNLSTLLIGAMSAGLLTACIQVPARNTAPTVTAAPEGSVAETQSAAPVTPSPSEKKVVIDGREYTCAQMLGLPSLECNGIFKRAFEKWGDKIDNYANSGKLGPLGNGVDAPVRYEDVAQLGLLACSVSEVGNTSTEYVPAAKTIVKTASGTELLPFWFEAQKSMCPEFPFKG
jgi:hypothetical protein